jgi:hypothetical protein
MITTNHSCRIRLNVPTDLVLFVSGLLAARRRALGTRKLGCYRQALFGLAWFRDKVSISRLGAGFGLSQATSYRYLGEVISVLAEKAPGLQEALERALAEGTPYVILDGTLISTDRCGQKPSAAAGTGRSAPGIRGSRKGFCGNIQGLMYPDGRPMWVSDVLPGHVNDLAAAKEQVFAVLRPFTGRMPCLTDGGYDPAGRGIHTPGAEAEEHDRTRHQHPHPQRPDPVPALPGRTRLRPAQAALARPQPRHRQPRQNRPDRPRRLVLTLFEHKMLT